MNSNPAERAFHAIISKHCRQFPFMQLEDLYKLIFQAAMGSEHAAPDPDQVLDRLESEATGVTTVRDNPLMMPLSPDHRLVRVNIVPFLAAGGRLDALAKAFIRTSKAFTPSKDLLGTYCEWATATADRGKAPFTRPALTAFFSKQRRQGFPAVHHSSQYRRHYRPAYRVVLKALISIKEV